jgi:hypothetical protein
MAIEKIEEVKALSKAAKTDIPQSIEGTEEVDRMAPNKERFDNLMNADQTKVQKPVPITEAIEPVNKSSLMDEVRNLGQKVDRFAKASPKDIIADAQDVIQKMEEAKDKLKSPDLDLKPSTQTVLQNKLLHIDENLRVALSKAGLEYAPSEHLANKRINPIDRFLGFLTNGQQQLGALYTEVEKTHLSNKALSPANMLRIQMKVGYISQEIEFFTAVLNKALDSTKTIMNVQV